MSYQIKQSLIPGLPKLPYRKGASAYEGGCAHSTATPEATAAKEVEYFKREWDNRNAFVHFFVDWIEIIQTADIDYKAWGAGKGNDRFFHVELCETKDPAKFKESYKRYVWLMAYLLKKKNLGVTDGKTLVSHAWVSDNLGGTDHRDPLAYLKSHGISWAQFVADVKAEYEGKKDGWVKENSQWLYYQDGKKTTGWFKVESKWYFFDAAGVMKTGWIRDKDNWFYLNKDGSMKKGMHKDEKGDWYYLQTNGSMAKNTSVNVTLTIGPDGKISP